MAEILYRKVGRRYVPVYDADILYADRLKVGAWRMEYCPADGSGRYRYDVTPDTAGFLAAAMLAKEDMEHAILNAAKSQPQDIYHIHKAWSPKQLRALETARTILAEAGVILPVWWTERSANDIAEAGITAVRTYASKNAES